MAAQPVPHYTPEEYLVLERSAETRHEYYDGGIYAMAGASEAHSLICVNLCGELKRRLPGDLCRGYGSNMRVRVSSSNLYTYPDITVVCGARDFVDERHDTILNPTVIFEVLSPTTERYDRGEKFAQYRQLESLTDYVLVSQDVYRVENYSRQPSGFWEFREAIGLEAELIIPSLGIAIPLSEIFDNVDVTVSPRAVPPNGGPSR